MDWVQSTISVPSGVAWSEPGQEASAWVMATDLATRASWDQVGWLWQAGHAQPILYAESGPTTFWLGPPLTPGSAVTVAVSCDFSTDIFHDWLLVGGGWTLLHTQATAISCGTELEWDRYVETDTPAGTSGPTLAQPVAFTATEADVLGAATPWPDLAGLLPAP